MTHLLLVLIRTILAPAPHVISPNPPTAFA
jgi:hypothetical protein